MRTRLESIRKQVRGRVRIVLHGLNGFSDDQMRQCVAAGVSKLNVNRSVLDDYNKHLREQAGKVPQTRLIDEGIQHVMNLQGNQFEVCGSSGKA